MNSVTKYACAKINLYLEVGNRRGDGYHDLTSVMQCVDIRDRITLAQSPGAGISLTTDSRRIPADNGNIVCKALEAVAGEYGIRRGMSVFVEKRIPISAGLGGGSADAAAAINAADELFGLSMTAERKRELGARVGSDVPFCVEGTPSLVRGRGEIITPIRGLPPCWIVLAKRGKGLSTRIMFENLDAGGRRPEGKNPDDILTALESGDVGKIGAALHNSFHPYVLNLHRESAGIYNVMKKYGPAGILVSGSGPSVYAIFPEDGRARECFRELKKQGGDVFLCRPIS